MECAGTPTGGEIMGKRDIWMGKEEDYICDITKLVFSCTL